MKFEEFHKQLADAPLSFRRKLRDYLRNPTERNTYYIAGYIAALEDARLFKTDAASYWLAVVGSTERDSATSSVLLAEMDNPPAGGAQAAEIKALREALAVLKAENENLRKVLKDADNELDWLDEEMDTCDHSVGVCTCSYRDVRRKMKATLFPAGPASQRGSVDIALLVLVISIVGILVAVGVGLYIDSQRPTIELKKDDWECVKLEQRTDLQPMLVGKTTTLLPMTSTVCVQYNRRAD